MLIEKSHSNINILWVRFITFQAVYNLDKYNIVGKKCTLFYTNDKPFIYLLTLPRFAFIVKNTVRLITTTNNGNVILNTIVNVLLLFRDVLTILL